MFSDPYIIKLVHSLFYNLRLVSQYSSLKVTCCFRFHSYSRTCEVGTTDIHLFAVEDEYFEVDARTKYPLQTVEQHRIFVEVLPKVRARLFCVNESYIHVPPNELGNESQKRLFRLFKAFRDFLPYRVSFLSR